MENIPVNDLKQARLKELLHYDPHTGIFTSLVKCGRRPKGSRPEAVQSAGYTQISIDGRRYLTHRLAWLYVYGQFPPEHIDHINLDKSDNRIVNLRAVTKSENARNKPGRSGKLKGAHRNASGTYTAQICVNHKRIYLGRYNTERDAHIAYCRAAVRYHGEYARLT